MASQTNNVELPADLPPPAPKSKLELVNRLGEIRDSLLVLASGLYFLGYLSWAFYAWEHQLGLLPVLDAQYFAAGVFPAVILLIFGLLVRWLFAAPQWAKKAPSESQEKVGYYLGVAGTLFLFTGVILSQFVSKAWGLTLFYIGAVFGYASAILLRQKGSKFLQVIGLFSIWIMVVIGSLWLLLSYVERWFPALPQEWGGPKPRCVRLDIDTAKISQETLGKILPDELSKDAKGVCRSKSLQMIFDGSEFVLLGDNFDAVEATHRFYKIKKDSIEAVFACD